MNVLVTGGAGYIGSHTCVELLNKGYHVIVVDNLVNSKQEALFRVEKITGKKIPFYPIDLRHKEALSDIFKKHAIDSVIHFAGLKAVGESVEKPLLYYDNNVTGTLSLCRVMIHYHVKSIVFSSSATVYGDPKTVPIREDFPLQATNPYGRTKIIIEDILKDLHEIDSSWRIAILRYFNPVGAHPSGLIGEDPRGIPNNLMPYIAQVAIGKLKELNVFGNDYPTFDGTGIRDYIHVVDLANGHIKALEKLTKAQGVYTYNLGTGHGYSVFEMIKTFEKVSGRAIPYCITDRRPGDIAQCYADPSLALKELGWKAEKTLEDMAADTWNWQINNPEGY